MNKDNRLSAEQIKKVIQFLNPSVNDYLYIYNVKDDSYCISNSALERFQIAESEFHNVWETLFSFVYPEDEEMLARELQRVASGQTEFHNLQYRWLGRDGEPVWINCRGQVLKDEEGKPECLVGCINEIGRTQTADNISGLLRESGLQLELKKAGEKLTGFLMRLGIDDFKEINENKGRAYGDIVLRRTAECIQRSVDQGQTVFCIRADEFAVLDMSGGNERKAEQLYHRIRSEVDRFIEENGYEVFYTISAGVLILDEMSAQDYDKIDRLSEFAMSVAKKRGKNQSYCYQQKDYEAFQRRRKLIRTMRRAVNENFEGFEVYFQPIVDITDKKLSAAEALLRFHSEETGYITPAEFIPILEESNLIIPVGKWVLRRAVEACSRIQQKIPGFRVSVNLSYVQVQKSNVLEDITDIMTQYELQSGSIIIELTESGFLESDASFIGFCGGLKQNGILLALDDFGTGYSNFHYLYNLSPDTLKIDRSFTVKALGNDYEYNLLRHMVDMAHSINLKLCIEGIETKEELTKISKMKPDYIQGYYFGSPCAFNTFWTEYIEKYVELKKNADSA